MGQEKARCCCRLRKENKDGWAGDKKMKWAVKRRGRWAVWEEENRKGKKV
jgi:hypothetical protein